MKQIRLKTFETNSSSTHSLVMCTEDEFKAFHAGKLYYCRWWWSKRKEFEKGKFYPVEEIDAYYETQDISREDDDCFVTWDEFIENTDLEYFEDTYTTKEGTTIYAFGVFGYDG